jgi:hypothetical protein
MISKYDSQSFGLFGSVNKKGLASGNATVTGRFCKLLCLTSTTFTELVDELASGDAITDITIPAGTELVGKFTSFKLADATSNVRAYNSGNGIVQ